MTTPGDSDLLRMTGFGDSGLLGRFWEILRRDCSSRRSCASQHYSSYLVFAETLLPLKNNRIEFAANRARLQHRNQPDASVATRRWTNLRCIPRKPFSLGARTATAEILRQALRSERQRIRPNTLRRNKKGTFSHAM